MSGTSPETDGDIVAILNQGILDEESRLDRLRRAEARLRDIEAVPAPEESSDPLASLRESIRYAEACLEIRREAAAILADGGADAAASSQPAVRSPATRSNGAKKPAPRSARQRATANGNGNGRQAKTSKTKASGSTATIDPPAAPAPASEEVMLAAAENLTRCAGPNHWTPKDAVAFYLAADTAQPRTARELSAIVGHAAPAGLLRTLAENKVLLAAGRTAGRTYRRGSVPLA